MAARKPTINKPKLNQPPDEDRFHVQWQLSVGAMERPLCKRPHKQIGPTYRQHRLAPTTARAR